MKKYRLTDLLGADKSFPFHMGGRIFKEEEEAFPEHRHTFSELTFIFSGKAHHTLNRQQEIIRAGDVFVFNGGNVAHGFNHFEDILIYNIMYDPRQFLPVDRELKKLPGFQALFLLEPAYRQKGDFPSRLHLSPAELAHARSLITLMEKEYIEKNTGYQSLIKALFHQLIIFLSRLYTRPAAASRSRALYRMAETIAYMETHFLENPPLPNLARMANLSVNQFLRVFRSLHNTSPSRYLIQLRLQKACDMMKEPDLKLTSIAMECGFTDSNYFSRQFRQTFGMTPRTYRNRLLPEGSKMPANG